MDNIAHKEGQCGRFQVIQTTLLQSCRFVGMWALCLMVFGLYNPGWRCVSSNSTTRIPPYYSPAMSSNSMYGNTAKEWIDQELANTTIELQNISGTMDNETDDLYDGTCDMISSCSYIEFDPTSSTIITEFGLVCDDLWKSRLIISILNCGMLVGAFVWGHLGEKFGRKVNIYGGNIIMCLSCALAVFSPTWEIYALFTFFIGIGAVGVIPSVNVLVMEFLNSKWRAIVVSLPVTNGALICFAVATYFLRNWKYIHLTTAFICLMSCFGFFWAPESLRWLVIHGKTEQAEKVIQKIAKLNKMPISSPESSPVNEQERYKTYTYLDLFKTSYIRSLTIKLCVMWSITIITYEIIGYGIQSLPGNFYITLIIASVIEFPGLLLVGPLANKYGRRRTGFLFTSIGILCCTAIVISLLAMDKCSVRDMLVTSLAILNKLTIYAIVSLMITFGSELIPTSVRSLAFGLFNISTRVTGMVAACIIPEDYISMIICFSVLMALQVVATAIFFSLPETKGKPLQDNIKPREIEASETEQL